MQWANSAGTEQGDYNRLYDSKSHKWCLAVADKNSDGGYRIVTIGNYEEVKEFEQLYKAENEGFDRYAETYESLEGTSDSGLWKSPNREMFGRNSRATNPKQAESKGNTSTGNDEYVRSDNRKTSAEIKRSDRDTLGNTLTEDQQSNFAESKAQGENEESRLKALNSSEDIKFSDRDFSYEAITSKPDMKVIAVNNQIPNNRADIVHIAKKNAASIGKRNKDGSVSVYVDDVDKDILLGTDGLKHGLRWTTSQENANFIVTLKAGEIIKNSIKINEMLPTKENASKSYVLLGAARSNDGDIYIVRSIVNQFNNELSSMDVLYAINTKKEMAVTESPRFAERPLSDTIFTISISDLLDYVNKYFPLSFPIF